MAAARRTGVAPPAVTSSAAKKFLIRGPSVGKAGDEAWKIARPHRFRNLGRSRIAGRRIIDQSPKMIADLGKVGTVICDLDQRILFVDDRYTEIVGRDAASLIGKPALSFTHGQDLVLNRPALDELAIEGCGFRIIKRYVHGDGNLIWVKNHVSKISDGTGAPVLSATTELIDRPFGSERLARNYEAARRLCGMLVQGRRKFTSGIFSAPAIEALLWLYRAEIGGRLLSADDLAAQLDDAPGTMIRWVSLLHERGLVVTEQPGPLSGEAVIRISANAERSLDDLLIDLAE